MFNTYKFMKCSITCNTEILKTKYFSLTFIWIDLGILENHELFRTLRNGQMK